MTTDVDRIFKKSIKLTPEEITQYKAVSITSMHIRKVMQARFNLLAVLEKIQRDCSSKNTRVNVENTISP